jgi:hypothetical protein
MVHQFWPGSPRAAPLITITATPDMGYHLSTVRDTNGAIITGTQINVTMT